MGAGAQGNIDDFVLNDETRVKWSSRLKESVETRKIECRVSRIKIRDRFTGHLRNNVCFSRMLNERRESDAIIFPTPASEEENQAICVSSIGHRASFTSLVTNTIPKLTVNSVDAFQCFPLYTYAEDGSNRQDNITAWALGQFQAAYGAEVTRRDIFGYVYAVLHHPEYRAHYAENLKRELPRLPLVEGAEAFRAYVAAGAELARLHTGYEALEPYPLTRVVIPGEPFTWRIEKMALSRDKTAVQVNPTLRLEGIPAEALAYTLGNRSALEWVIDQYQVSTDKRSGIRSDPNRREDPEYIARLVGQVIAVSVATRRVVAGLPGQLQRRTNPAGSSISEPGDDEG